MNGFLRVIAYQHPLLKPEGSEKTSSIRNRNINYISTTKRCHSLYSGAQKCCFRMKYDQWSHDKWIHIKGLKWSEMQNAFPPLKRKKREPKPNQACSCLPFFYIFKSHPLASSPAIWLSISHNTLLNAHMYTSLPKKHPKSDRAHWIDNIYEHSPCYSVDQD
jgi:hypothetical protein